MSDDFDFDFDFMDALTGQLEEAKRLNAQWKHQACLDCLNQLPAMFQNDLEVLGLRARSYKSLGLIQNAYDAWNAIVQLDQSNEVALISRSQCMFDMGHQAQALTAIHQVVQTYPANLEAKTTWLLMRVVSDDPRDIIAGLADIKNQTNNSKAFASILERVRAKMVSLHDAALLIELDDADVLQLKESANEVGYNLRHIYTCFEPVGNNCEFGFAQRHRSAEPLSLFRWTSITHANLLRLLHSKLVDYDLPERYSLGGNFQVEYFLKDSEYESASHTGVKASDISPDEFLLKLRKRQVFLKRKFLEDAQAGQKIFLHKVDGPLSESHMAELQTAFEALGVQKTLFVMRATPEHPGGSFHLRNSNSMVGYLSKNMPETQFTEWDKIVVGVYDTFKPTYGQNKA